MIIISLLLAQGDVMLSRVEDGPTDIDSLGEVHDAPLVIPTLREVVGALSPGGLGCNV